jgi:hypothetical protein
MYRGKKVPNPGHVLQFTPLKDEMIPAARSIWILQASVGLARLRATGRASHHLGRERGATMNWSVSPIGRLALY